MENSDINRPRPNLDKLMKKITETEEDNPTTERKIDHVFVTNLKPYLEEENGFSPKISEPDSLSAEIVFQFVNGTFLSYDMSIVLQTCPAIARHQGLFNSRVRSVNVQMPGWLSSDNIIEFFLYINDEANNFNMSVRKLLFIADFFDNQKVVCKIIKNEIIPNLSTDDSLLFLEDSFTKLNIPSENNQIWFDLFYACLMAVEKDFQFLLEKDFDKISKINKEILEEIIEK